MPRDKAPVRVGSPRWLVPLMLALFGVGLVWILVYYVTAPTSYPVPSVGAWNVAIGFGFIAAGFGLATQWK